MRAIRYKVERELTGATNMGLSQSAMRAIRYKASHSMKEVEKWIQSSQSAMRAIRYKVDVIYPFNQEGEKVAIRYACNKI